MNLRRQLADRLRRCSQLVGIAPFGADIAMGVDAAFAARSIDLKRPVAALRFQRAQRKQIPHRVAGGAGPRPKTEDSEVADDVVDHIESLRIVQLRIPLSVVGEKVRVERQVVGADHQHRLFCCGNEAVANSHAIRARQRLVIVRDVDRSITGMRR